MNQKVKRICHRALTKIQLRIIFLATMSMIFCFISCKSPASPEVPSELTKHTQNYEYRENVEIIYTREESKVTNVEYAGEVWIRCFLYSPEDGDPSFSYYKIVELNLKEVDKNIFKVFINRVLNQEIDRGDKEHYCFFKDKAITLHSALGKNIEIEGGYDCRIVDWAGTTEQPGTALFFKMSRCLLKYPIFTCFEQA